MSQLPSFLASPQDQVTQYARELAQLCPLLDGQIVSGTFPGSAAFDIPHSLGRAYRGAFCVAASVSGSTAVAFDPDTAVAAGTDVRSAVRVHSTSSTSMTVTMWVF